MDQSRYEFFLDDGWNLIGQLHVWLSKWPTASHDQSSLVELITELQATWAGAEDLGFRRLARICLALEQSMERFCARNLECTLERLNDLANAVSCLQEVLLGLEATREEPAYDMSSIAVIERHLTLPNWVPPVEPENAIVKLDRAAIVPDESERAAKGIVPLADSDLMNSIDEKNRELVAERDYVDRTLLVMLEEFVSKIDETCHMLHVRMVTDQMPYVSTTSRLEQLAHSTRELVSDIARQARASVETIPFETVPAIPAAVMPEPVPMSLELHDEGLGEVVESTPVPEPHFQAVDRHEEISEADAGVEQQSLDPVVVAAPPAPKRILIVEESLFFRHLIGLAVQSAGFEACSAETVAQGLGFLNESPEFHAILIGSVVSSEIAHAISFSRHNHGAKVIGLVASESVERQSDGVDACVSRSNPIELISKLKQILSEPIEPIRMSA